MLTLKLEITQAIPDLSAQAQAEMARIVAKTAIDIEAGAKTAIQSSPASGRVYGAHKASAPGEAPATDTGNLAGSIQSVSAGPLTWEVHVSAEYAETLELGGVHVAARPFLSPAVDAVRPGFEAAVAQAVK